MSAFIVSKDTIDAIVTFVDRHDIWPAGFVESNLDRKHNLGSILWAENYRSFNYRYSHNEAEGMPAYHYQIYGKRVDAVTFIKLVHCLNYQACECPDYKNTEAFRIIDALIWHASSLISGYEAAPWGL